MNQLETIGIDFGGTNTRVAHFEGDRILKLIEFATPKRPEEFIEEFTNVPKVVSLLVELRDRLFCTFFGKLDPIRFLP